MTPAGAGDAGTSVPLAGSRVVDAAMQAQLRSAVLHEIFTSKTTVAVAGAVAAGIAIGVELTERSLLAAGLTLVFVAAGIALVARRTTKARIAHGYPLGSVIAAGFGARVVRLDTGDLVEELDHRLFDTVAVGADVVRLRFRVGGTALVPRGLVSEPELQRIVAGVGDPAPAPRATDGLPWAHTVTAGDDHARRSRVLRALHRARRRLWGGVVFLAVAIALPTASWLPFLLLLVIPLQEVQDRLRVARADALVFAEGAELRAGIESDRLLVRTPTALFSRPLSRLEEVIALPDLVVLRWDLPLFETQYPPGLFPASALARLKAAARR